MTQTSRPSGASTEAPRRAFRAGLVPLLGGTAVVLGIFDFFSARSALARRGLLAERPPVYGRFTPHLPPAVVAPILVGVLGVLVSVYAVRRGMGARALVSGAVAFLLVFGAIVALADGGSAAIVAPIQRVSPPDYQPDVPVAATLGIRGFVRRYPELVPALHSIHSQTHPPGPVVLLALLQGLFPHTLVPRALAIALLGSLVIPAGWFLARAVAGERAAGFAVVLLAVAPGVVLFTFTSMDAVFATLIVATAALLVVSIRREGAGGPAFLAGVAAALTVFFTYAVVFIAVFGTLFAVAELGLRRALRPLLFAGAGAVAGLLVLRLATGFDLMATYRATHTSLTGLSQRSYGYWLFGNVGAWLTFAGLPIAALGIRGLFSRTGRFLVCFLAPLAVFYLLPSTLTKIVPGEVERTLQFAYPFGAAAAGMVLARAELDPRKAARIAGALVLIAVAQTIALEMLYNTFW